MASPLSGTPPRSVWKAVGYVAAVMILLISGWPLASRLLSDERHAAPGSLPRPMPGAGAVSPRAPIAGWPPGRSGPGHGRGASHRRPDLTASYVDIGDPADVSLLWSGPRRVWPAPPRPPASTARLGPPAANAEPPAPRWAAPAA